MRASDHYDKEYFRSQSAFDELQGSANIFKFAPYIDDQDHVLDFGCGSGALLRAIGLRDGRVIGVEINPTAADFARAHGVEVKAGLQDIESDSIDVLISNHALEHVENPLEVMRDAFRVVRPGGKVVIVVPCDAPSFRFRENDRDMHLFSWSANNIGNLLKIAGFEVAQCDEILHRWPPRWWVIQRRFGWRAFHIAAAVWARIDRRRSQVRAVAWKPI